jgi:hypothetical protein
VPYVTPYYSEIELALKTCALEQPEVLFYIPNTLFHEPRVCRKRSQPVLARFLLAEELKQGGNRNFWSGRLQEALMNYEHALGLFDYLVKDGTQWKVVQETLLDAHELSARQGVKRRLLLNCVAVLIKLKHFREARRVLDDGLQNWRMDAETTSLRCWLSAVDLESSVEDLENALCDLKRVVPDSPFKKTLLLKLEERRATLNVEMQKFFNKFLGKLLNYSGKPQAYSGLEFEHLVLIKLEGKYTGLFKYLMEMERSALNSRSELQDLKAVITRMNFIQQISPSQPPPILKTLADDIGVDLQDPGILGVFEGTKRQMIVEAFAEGTYNQNLLSYCIEQCHDEQIQTVAKLKPVESEGFFTWQLGLSLFLLFAYGIYCYIEQTSSVLGRMS